jgi:hypothetical protein
LTASPFSSLLTNRAPPIIFMVALFVILIFFSWLRRAYLRNSA